MRLYLLLPCQSNNYHHRVTQTHVNILYMPATIKTMDYWTQVALSAIWKEQVQECIANDIETGITDDWELIEQTPFTEPFWGIVVNK